jgi:hypothetical protein
VSVMARDPAGSRTAAARTVRLPALVTVAVSGDLLIHTQVAARALANGGRRAYRFGPMLARIEPFVRRADIALCHVEHPVGRGPPSGYPRFRAPASLGGAVRAAGFDVCGTASNHTLDYGQPGIDATLRALDRAGVRHTGSWARPPAGPALVRMRGVTVGFVAATEHTNGIARPTPGRSRSPIPGRSWRPPAGPAAPGRTSSSSTSTGAPSTGTRPRPSSGCWPAGSSPRPP